MRKERRRKLNNKRAVSAVLSNLLLTVVAVAAMALATTATYVVTTGMRDTMSERIIFEDVWFNPITNTINVYVSNVGKVAVQFSNLYINHTSQAFAGSVTLDLNQNEWLNISQSWTSSSLYHVDLVTTRGTHVEGNFESP